MILLNISNTFSRFCPINLYHFLVLLTSLQVQVQTSPKFFLQDKMILLTLTFSFSFNFSLHTITVISKGLVAIDKSQEGKHSEQK